MRVEDRRKLMTELLEEYDTQVPEGMVLEGKVGIDPDFLEFLVVQRVVPGIEYGGTFRMSREALADGLDARPGIEALLERARSGTLPVRPAGEAAALLLICTSVGGLRSA
jgi:hypothetical protein